MKWTYEIEWMDGDTALIDSRFLFRPGDSDLNLTIQINAHGHDQRTDCVVIPLANVRKYAIREVQ